MTEDKFNIPDIRPLAFWLITILLCSAASVSLAVALYGVLKIGGMR